jgi:hypothetical protein
MQCDTADNNRATAVLGGGEPRRRHTHLQGLCPMAAPAQLDACGLCYMMS